MPTSIHLPKALLAALDRRAKYLRVSRNRLIVQTLEREMQDADAWSPGFFERLEQTDDRTKAAVDDMLDNILKARNSREPQIL